MIDKKLIKLLLMIFWGLSIYFLVLVVSYQKGYDKGYQEGQINYSLGKIKYTVMDGIKVHFYGFVDKEIKEE